MINFDEYTNKNKIEHNSNCPYIPDHPYRILIIGGSESGKTNALLNLINNQPDINKIYPKAFIEYSNNMHDVYKNIDHYNPDKENKILIVFDDLIADMIDNKKLNSIITELFIRSRKQNIFLVFITQSYFKVPKDVRLNTTHLLIMRISNKRELQQIALNHSSDINTKDFINIYNECTDKPY